MYTSHLTAETKLVIAICKVATVGQRILKIYKGTA